MALKKHFQLCRLCTHSDPVADGKVTVTPLKCLLRPERLRDASRCADGASMVFRALDVEAVVTELGGERAEEGEEEHDQRPLTSSCVHVETLRHQREVCTG